MVHHLRRGEFPTRRLSEDTPLPDKKKEKKDKGRFPWT